MVLRQALGYCWSVAAAACPPQGKRRIERWAASPDKDVRWVVRENLTKNRLAAPRPNLGGSDASAAIHLALMQS